MVYFLLELFISAILPNIMVWMKNSEISSLVIIYVLMLILKDIISLQYRKTIGYIGLQKQKEFHFKTLQKYSTLSQFDRESESIHVFLDALNDMKYVIGIENIWYKVTYKTFITMIITTISTMYSINTYQPIFYICLCYASVYVLIKSHISKMNNQKKQYKKVSRTIDQQNRFEYSKLRLGYGSTNNIVERKYNQMLNHLEYNNNWIIMNLYVTLPLLFALLLSVMSNQPADYTYNLELIMFFVTLYQNIHHIAGYMGTYDALKLKKEKFSEFWKGKTFTPLPPQQDISEYIITDYRYNNVPLKFNGQPVINSGDIIRLTGATGVGKTTFVDSLKGVVKGIKLKSGIDPMCFLNKISHMRQDIRDSIPFNDVTIKDLFGQYDDDTIIQVLSVVGLTKWLKDTMDNNLYKMIHNKISGGQKTLLCMALSLIDSIDKEMLILDEPEQGLDMELIPEVLANAFQWIKDKNPTLRIIFISHLCDCVINRLNPHSHWHIVREDNECFMNVS